MNEGANRVATALLKMGVKAGDHIGLCAPNSPEWLIFYFGVLKAGAVAVTLGSALSPMSFVCSSTMQNRRFFLHSTTD